jgi:hypothetical protein
MAWHAVIRQSATLHIEFKRRCKYKTLKACPGCPSLEGVTGKGAGSATWPKDRAFVAWYRSFYAPSRAQIQKETNKSQHIASTRSRLRPDHY